MVEEGSKISLDETPVPIIAIAKERRIQNMALNDMPLSDLDKSFHLCAVEREVYEGSDMNELHPIELVIVQPKRSFYIFNENKPLT